MLCGSNISNTKETLKFDPWMNHLWQFSFFSGQMFLLDRFFDGTFLTFGIEVISFADRDQEDRIDPMVYIFPR